MLATTTARCHVLDVASLLDREAVDVLRQAANATVAGPDWYLALMPNTNARSRRAPVLVAVASVDHTGPLRCELSLHWRTMSTVRQRSGLLCLQAFALALGPRALTELTLVDDRRRTMLRSNSVPTRQREPAQRFLSALARQLEQTVSLTNG